MGYPPPELSWDNATFMHISNAMGRLEVSTTAQQISDGNWTMQSTIIFNEIYINDDGEYFCVAENSVGSKTLRYSVTVISSEPSLKQALILGASFTLGLLGLLAVPTTYLIYTMRAKVWNIHSIIMCTYKFSFLSFVEEPYASRVISAV